MTENGATRLVEASHFAGVLPDTGSQACGYGCTKGGDFVHGRPFNRDADDIGLGLHNRDTLVFRSGVVEGQQS